MTTRPPTVLVAGATGSIGRLVVEEAIRHGYRTRALGRRWPASRSEYATTSMQSPSAIKSK